MAIALKDTLNLPETDFPMRANLVEREASEFKKREESGLYRKILDKHKNSPAYIMHDGPPFTNGDVHIGTALNKILKDTILRYKSMKGFRTPYIPGWDCHGLPIEHKVIKELQEKKKERNNLALRKACAKFSNDYIKIQSAQFKRLGILADWENEYKTMDPEYEAQILRTFADFVEQGLVYRGKKPVYWSVPCATALAEAEIEYQDHVSPSVYVKFPVPDAQALGFSYPLNIVVWTTTPWTLPSNMAIAVNPKLQYVEIYYQDQTFFVAEELADKFIKTCKLEGAKRHKLHEGKSLEGLKAHHPFIDRESPVILADFVTTETGTGCVHIAPGHGIDDYFIGLNYKLDIYSPIDDKGFYINDGKIPSRLVGVTVFESEGRCPANEEVLKILKETNTLVFQEKYKHQYPFCWRSKTPVITRAMDQWFIGLDLNNTRKKALEAIKTVKWLPEWGQLRMTGAVEYRPDWCISRQRVWGVPIPVFYNKEGKPLLDEEVIRAIANKIEEKGSDFWFSQSAKEILEGISLPKEFEGEDLIKGGDTLDVWIDSGSSNQAVLRTNPELDWPADLYFEGSDQHRGWFQSSLWTGVVASGGAPYREVITHGFVVKEDKTKISKSDTSGKPQTAEGYVNKYGADIIRLWINSEDFRGDIPISDDILQQVVNAYRTIRNTLRFQLGNLYDFDLEKNAVPIESMTLIDKWVLHHTAKLITSVTESYETFQFHKAYQSLNRFCSAILSATYHDILKDRLYTLAPSAHERRSSQTAIYYIFEVLVRLLAPILTFTADEAYKFLHPNAESLHLEDWPKANFSWENDSVLEDVEKIFKVRDKVNEKLEEARQNKMLGQSLDAQVVLFGSMQDPVFQLLKKYESLLPQLFIVSQVKLQETIEAKLDVEIKMAEGYRCPRCWRWVPELVFVENFGEVSPRCKVALLEKYPS